MGLMTSLRIANPVGGSATLGLLCENVEIILCDYSFRADLHVMRYLGLEIDFLGKDWLNYYEAHIPCPMWTILLRHFQSVKQVSVFPL